MVDPEDKDEGTEPLVSAYLLHEPRILRDACRMARRDDDGRRCPECDLLDFCQAQAHRAEVSASAA